MGTLNAASLVEKLSKLNSTQASIETLSEWCTFHRREAGRVVGIWDQEFNQAPSGKRLVLLYLANDILQNSRKKVPPLPHRRHTIAHAKATTNVASSEAGTDIQDESIRAAGPRVRGRVLQGAAARLEARDTNG